MIYFNQVKPESSVQEEHVIVNDEVVEHIVEQLENQSGVGNIQEEEEEQTIYLDAEGRGTATAIVDGKEVGSSLFSNKMV